MKKNMLIFFLFISKIAFSQSLYSSCSAVFLNDQMIVEEYSNKAQAKISKETKGWVSAGVVTLGDESKSEKKVEIIKKFEFAVAIKDGNTGTIILFSPKAFKKIEIEKVLFKCRKGDSIIILTTEDEYALPQNNLLVY